MDDNGDKFQWISDAKAVVDGFDFSNCYCIKSLSISERNERTFLDVCFYYNDEAEALEGTVSFRFLNLLITKVSFCTTKMWLSDFFVSYNDEEFCVFDEMSDLKWTCEEIQFLHFSQADN